MLHIAIRDLLWIIRRNAELPSNSYRSAADFWVRFRRKLVLGVISERRAAIALKHIGRLDRLRRWQTKSGNALVNLPARYDAAVR